MSNECTPQEVAEIERQMLALYELRLASIGTDTHDENVEDRKVRMWAATTLAEAMCCLELRFGADAAQKMAADMLKSRAEYTGPRTRRIRH